jgi:mannonate dehydratase
LAQIAQTPCISGVAACLPKIPVGDVWPIETLRALKREINEAGLEMEVIESVNIHEDIKKGLPSRDRYIQNYIETVRNLAEVGVKCLCYNFMPVMDWVRSDLAHRLPDGSQVLSYRHAKLTEMTPLSMADSMLGKAEGFSLPGWEPDRFGQMAADILFYQGISVEEYWGNLAYFLDAVVPVAEGCGINMAIHPDDPPWPLFGLPKLINSAENIRRLFDINKSPCNGITLCSGSLGADPQNDVPALAREFAKRIHFAHLRNLKRLSGHDFDESAHPSQYGDLDMFKIVEALYRGGFDGYVRPDHGRMIWGEVARPGYGLYDRALGSSYLSGLWEAVDKMAGPRQ